MDPSAQTSQPAEPDRPPQPQDENCEDKETYRRNGFVARKPKHVRDKINRLLDDGITYKQVVEKLGPDGEGLTERHIQSWALGGYKDYIARQQLLEDLNSTRERATEINSEKAGIPAQDAARTIAAGQLLELLKSFDPASFAKELNQDPGVYLGLVNAVARLSESEAECMHRRIQQAVLASKLTNPDGGATGKPPTESELKDITRDIKLL